MSAYMTSAKRFSMKADVSLEVIPRDGPEAAALQLVFPPPEAPVGVPDRGQGEGRGRRVLLRREDADAVRPEAQRVCPAELAGTTDDAIRAWERETGIAATGADLLLTGVYSILTKGVRSSDYFGTGWVNGVECHHLSLRRRTSTCRSGSGRGQPCR